MSRHLGVAADEFFLAIQSSNRRVMVSRGVGVYCRINLPMPRLAPVVRGVAPEAIRIRRPAILPAALWRATQGQAGVGGDRRVDRMGLRYTVLVQTVVLGQVDTVGELTPSVVSGQ